MPGSLAAWIVQSGPELTAFFCPSERLFLAAAKEPCDGKNHASLPWESEFSSPWKWTRNLWWTGEWFTHCSLFNSKPCGVCPQAAYSVNLLGYVENKWSLQLQFSRAGTWGYICFPFPHPSSTTVIMRMVHLVNSPVTATNKCFVRKP